MTLSKVLIAAVGLSFSLMASPINVSYTVTGSSGDWTLDFSVMNNLSGAPNQNFYFFGVDLSSQNPTGSPAGFVNDDGLAPWSNSGFGGSSELYNNLWIAENSESGLQLPGTTTSGFEVTITDAVAPTSVDFFAFTVDDGTTSPYTAGGNFGNDENPGFEGIATETETSGVPEPSTLALLAAGFAVAVVFGRRRTK